MTEVSAISTICKNCLFAKYDDNTQIGCEFNRTKTVANHPVYDLIEAEDGDKEFFILNNHICPYQRTEGWAHSNSNDIVSAVKAEVVMPWAAILFYRNDGRDALEARIKEIRSQSVPPKVITLVLGAGNLDKDELTSLHQMMEDNFEIWYLHKVLLDDLTDRFAADLCFDKMKKHRFMFYTYFETNQSIDLDYYDKIHKYVIDDMNTYGIIKDKKNPDNLQHITISKIAHMKYGGNGNSVDIEHKISHENKDLTLADISENSGDETLEEKFIVEYGEL